LSDVISKKISNDFQKCVVPRILKDTCGRAFVFTVFRNKGILSAMKYYRDIRL